MFQQMFRQMFMFFNDGRGAVLAVVLFIAFGLVLALVWARLYAVDVALAEMAIGAGVTGALLLAALVLWADRPRLLLPLMCAAYILAGVGLAGLVQDRVPLIMRIPGVAGGRRVAGTVGLVDVMPTICGLLGVSWSESDGEDLSPMLLDGNDGDADRVGVVDEHGAFVNQLQVYGLLAYYMLAVRGERGGPDGRQHHHREGRLVERPGELLHGVAGEAGEHVERIEPDRADAAARHRQRHRLHQELG